MEKKILKIAGIAICCSALFATAFVSMNEEASSDVTLNQLLLATDANAECVSTSTNDGYCNPLSGNCFWSYGRDECDPSVPY